MGRASFVTLYPQVREEQIHRRKYPRGGKMCPAGGRSLVLGERTESPLGVGLKRKSRGYGHTHYCMSLDEIVALPANRRKDARHEDAWYDPMAPNVEWDLAMEECSPTGLLVCPRLLSDVAASPDTDGTEDECASPQESASHDAPVAEQAMTKAVLRQAVKKTVQHVCNEEFRYHSLCSHSNAHTLPQTILTRIRNWPGHPVGREYALCLF